MPKGAAGAVWRSEKEWDICVMPATGGKERCLTKGEERDEGPGCDGPVDLLGTRCRLCRSTLLLTDTYTSS